jgi:hypothetical protein
LGDFVLAAKLVVKLPTMLPESQKTLLFQGELRVALICNRYNSIFIWPQILYKEEVILRNSVSFWGACSAVPQQQASGAFVGLSGEYAQVASKPALQPVDQPL